MPASPVSASSPFKPSSHEPQPYAVPSISRENSYDSPYTGPAKTEMKEDLESLENSYTYIPAATSCDDYDYECPYWEPSGEKRQLLAQFRKLGIRSLSQKELE